MRTLYGRAIASTVTSAHPVWYTRHGYTVIVKDVRGRGDSEGQIMPFSQEVEHGYDAVEWAATLTYSNGRVGMYGFSYQGVVQWAAASAHPLHLVAIAPGMCTADLYARFYPHGLSLGKRSSGGPSNSPETVLNEWEIRNPKRYVCT